MVIGYSKIQMPFQVLSLLAKGESLTTQTTDHVTKGQVHTLYKGCVNFLHSQGLQTSKHLLHTTKDHFSGYRNHRALLIFLIYRSIVQILSWFQTRIGESTSTTITLRLYPTAK